MSRTIGLRPGTSRKVLQKDMLGIAMYEKESVMEEAKIISKASSIELEGGLEQVFPLFGPVREKEWAEGWNPRMVLPYPDLVEEHMVFQTESGHPEDPSPATWIVSKYDPDHWFIEYTVFTQARIWWISVECREEERAARTSATIKYTYLGLDEEANRLNQTALERMFRQDLKDWEHAINHYLKTGTLLSHSHQLHHGNQ